MEFRLAVAAAHDECGPSSEVAEEFGRSEFWVRRLMQQERETGSPELRPAKRPDNRKLDATDLDRLAAAINERPDLTLAELAAALGNKASIPTVLRARRRFGFSRKKSLHAAEQDRPDVKAARDGWLTRFQGVAVDRLVFLDEFGAATNMTRTHALAKVGERAVCRVPHGHWKTISTIAAMGTRGMVAAAGFDGATDTELFLLFVRGELVPQLRPGPVLVLDNLPAHKSPWVDRMVEQAGCVVLRLSPYSPDYNPIEMAISKMKRLPRSRAERTVAELFDGIGGVLRRVTPDDALAIITHCGYAVRSD